MFILSKVLPFFLMPLGVTTALVLGGILFRRRILCLAGLLVSWAATMPVTILNEEAVPVYDVVRSQPSLLEAAKITQKTYRINTELLAWQINNSSARRSLTDEERTRLEQWKTGMLQAVVA